MRSPNILLATLILSLFAASGRADTSLNGWLNDKIQTLLKANVDLRSESRQSETPSQGENSTTLVDRGSSAALIGLALNLAGLPTSAEADNESAASVSVNAYSFYAAVKGIDPLDPENFNANPGWRNLSFTVGYDDEPLPDDSGDTQRTQLLGFKYLLIDKRQPGANDKEFKDIAAKFTSAIMTFQGLDTMIRRHILSLDAVQSRMRAEYKTFLAKQSMSPQEQSEAESRLALGADGRPLIRDPVALQFFAEFSNSLFGANFTNLVQELGADQERELERMVEAEVDSFVQLEQDTQTALAKIRTAPQLSFSTLSKQRPEGADDYSGQLIFEWGFGSRLNFVANGSYDYKDNKGSEEDAHKERVALQLGFQIGPERIVGRSPFRFSLAAEGNRMSTEEDDTWKAQAKLTIPVLDGVELPISVTFASKTALIEEEDVRGLFGFTLDVARLVDGLRARAGNGGGT